MIIIKINGDFNNCGSFVIVMIAGSVCVVVMLSSCVVLSSGRVLDRVRVWRPPARVLVTGDEYYRECAGSIHRVARVCVMVYITHVYGE